MGLDNMSAKAWVSHQEAMACSKSKASEVKQEAHLPPFLANSTMENGLPQQTGSVS